MKSLATPFVNALLLLSPLVAADFWEDCACVKNGTLDNASTVNMCNKQPDTGLLGTWCYWNYKQATKYDLVFEGSKVHKHCLVVGATGSCCADNSDRAAKPKSDGCPAPEPADLKHRRRARRSEA
ncbi:hypothetical protein P8C59_009013 [Phyllachora maydis]|uniref:Secreted protein n=1 Tax=Phyllachora maydis TaxID=1825666 RepID=A0AAD9IBS7_9PEZI|nr:hypothetical protein P8C59_009013 [Phyllachora maydis]